MTAELPTFLKSWDWTAINTRESYSSLNDASAAVMYAIKVRLLANGGSVVYTCDGTTGPSSSSDHTDRWSSKANCTTRGATAGTAQSFAVISFAGVQLLITYQGSTDDVFRVAFSQGSLYTPAGTANQQPTATDETKWAEGITMVGTATSGDRVFSPVCATDGTLFRCNIYSQGSNQRGLTFERITEAPGVTIGTVLASNWTSDLFTSPTSVGGVDGTSTTAGGTGQISARVNGTNVTCFQGTVIFGGATNPFAANPQLNGGMLVFPVFYACGTANNTGVVGTRLDTYYGWTNNSSGTGPTDGFTLDDLTQNERLIVWANNMQPWSPTAGLVVS